ncbi:MAG: type I DNA topoisomerase [Chloroflexota bacterium]
MARKLVIVESPAKARTLGRILGSKYSIKASLGHIRDLPKKSLGVSINQGFVPRYVVPREKSKVMKEIKQALGNASAVYLATDPDREGEAISWHLVKATKLDEDGLPLHRVVFHEITREAVEKAFRNPREIDMNLVNAQQARRVLDRLVGYKLSPLLWQKVQKGLSAGRVQSVAVRLVVDREYEINHFVPKEYWTIEVDLSPVGGEPRFRAKLVKTGSGSKIEVRDEKKAAEIAADLRKADYDVSSVETKRVSRGPAPPFITSTLQQEASRKLHFTPKRTMVLAQQLYEGLPLADGSPVGLITYMRTDSTHIATSAVGEIRDFIGEQYGPAYVPEKPRRFAKKGKWAQEAHEAIRPTGVRRTPDQVEPYLERDQMRLYDLIWKRAVASQMAAAEYDSTTVKIRAGLPNKKGYLLEAGSSTLAFPGFITLYSEGKDDEHEVAPGPALPDLKEGEQLRFWDVFTGQHFTQPPPRYTEATLIKALEQKGIGRPSTYAPILSLIQDRDYVTKEAGRFVPARLGLIVNELLTQHFPEVVDVNFTAQMESHLDDVARGEEGWTSVVQEFYSQFESTLLDASEKIEKVNTDEPTDEVCPTCGRPMVIRAGRYGKFLACTGYPECKTTKPYLVKTGVRCPQCGGELVERMSRKKRVFYGCSNYPRCTFTTGNRPLPQPCPVCGGLLVQAGSSRVRCSSCGYRGSLSDLPPSEEGQAHDRSQEARDTAAAAQAPTGAR